MPCVQAAFGAVVALLHAPDRARLPALIAAAACGAAQAHGPEPKEGNGVEPPKELEEALRLVQRCSGLEKKPGAPEAKRLLREREGKAVASKLGRLTKCRNYLCHPSDLMGDIQGKPAARRRGGRREGAA